MQHRDIQRIEGTIGSTLGALAAAGPVAVFALVGVLYGLAFLVYGIKHVSVGHMMEALAWCSCVAMAVFVARVAMRSLKAPKRIVRIVNTVLCVPLIVPFEVTTGAFEGMTGTSYKVWYHVSVSVWIRGVQPRATTRLPPLMNSA